MTWTAKKSAPKTIIILALFLTVSLLTQAPRQVQATGQYSVNAIVNPSFENGLLYKLPNQPWVTDTYNDGNVGSTITANSTLSTTGNYSARLDIGPTPIFIKNATLANTFGHITLYQQNQTTIYFGNLTNRPDALNFWVYIQPKFAGFTFLEIRIKAQDSTELDYFYANSDLFSTANVFQNSTNGGELHRPVKDIVLPTPAFNRWMHFARNLGQDWLTPMTNLPPGQTDSGFNRTETLSRVMIEATFYQQPFTHAIYGMTAWIDDVNLYVNSNTPPLPPPPSNYWTTFDFTDANGASVNSMAKWRMFNSTGSLVSGYTQRDSTLRLEPYYVEVYYPTTTGQSPEPYRILDYKIIYLNSTATIRLQMYTDLQGTPPWGYVALNNTATINFNLENASLMQFNLHGTPGIPYTILVAANQKPILIQRNNDDPSLVQWTYDSTAVVVRITTITTGNFSIFLTPPIKVPAIGFTDLLSNPVSNNLSWRLFNSQGTQVTIIPGQYLQKDNYTLQVYYYGYLIYKGNLDPATSSLKLQMFPLSSPETGYIAFSSSVNSITILENTATALSFKAQGTGPSTIAVNVLAKPIRIEKDGAEISSWTYNSTTGTVAIQATQLGTFTISYSNATPTIPLSYVGAVVAAIAIATAGLLIWKRTKSRTPTQRLPAEKKSETKEQPKSKQKIPSKGSTVTIIQGWGIFQVRPAILVLIIVSTALYGISNIAPVHSAGLTGSFVSSPQFILAGGNDSFTGTASGGTAPYKFNWTFGDGPLIANGSFVTHIYSAAGNYVVKLSITDSLSTKISATNTITVHGSPLNIDGWLVNWNITDHHGVEIYNATYNGIPTIRDALINGVSVVYFQQPPGLPSCLFFDDLGRDDLAASIAGFTVQTSTDPSNPWFQIRAGYNPSRVGYNYTQFWRFYASGEWDATLYVGHLGCGWNHNYQPHFRIDLAIGNKNRDIMSQYTPTGIWQNLIWEGNYTDNGFRDVAHNATQWRLGDGAGYYYIVPKVSPYAGDMPKIAPKIYLVRDRPGELEPDINPPATPADPITFVNGELAYRQSIAFWYLPTFGDHWLYSVGQTPIGSPSIVSLAFYPYNI